MSKKEIFDYEYCLKDVYMPCIYFLYKAEKVVYVGQSKFGLLRVLTHTKDKDFDTIKIKKCNIGDLNEQEMIYIAKYAPKYNKTLPNAYNCSNLKLIFSHNGYSVRKNVIRDWIYNNVKNYYFFHGEIYISEKDKEFTINGIYNYITK